MDVLVWSTKGLGALPQTPLKVLFQKDNFIDFRPPFRTENALVYSLRDAHMGVLVCVILFLKFLGFSGDFFQKVP